MTGSVGGAGAGSPWERWSDDLAAGATSPAPSTPPTPEELADAWKAAFGPVIRAAAGGDRRLTRTEAERITRRDAPGWLASDNAVAFMKSTGQQTISAEVLITRIHDHVLAEARKVAGANDKISLAEGKRLPKDLQADFLFLRGKPIPPHRSWAELAVEVKDIVSARWSSWPATPLPQPPWQARGERPIIESLPHPTDRNVRAIVYVAAGRIYASIARSGAAQPGQPKVGWYDMGAVPPGP